jgi:UDP-N-acetyl-D-glucosamine dehydrogenase
MPEKVVVIGQGYVGLPLALRAVDVGYDVVGVEVSLDRATLLAAGRTYIEDVSDEQLRKAVASGRYTPSIDYQPAQSFDIALITVPTPLRDGGPDLSYIQAACESISPHMTDGCLVVVESTTYPGTTESFVRPLLDAGSGLTAGDNYSLGFSPERIDPGNPNWTLVNTPKVVSGLTPECLKRVIVFYESIVDRVVPVRSPREAELAKLMENTFRHINIALVNELAIFSHELDIDIWSALDAAETKPFGFMRFNPGPGVGGHCLPIDPTYLSWEIRRRIGRSFRFVDVANDVNAEMPRYVSSRVGKMLNNNGKPIRGSRVLVFGLTYKKDSNDARESPATEVATLLARQGAEVLAVDPHVNIGDLPDGVALVETSAALELGIDIAVILTAHSAFDYTDLIASGLPVLDTRNALTQFDAANVVLL